jgi:exodeoxyribonuclease-5
MTIALPQQVSPPVSRDQLSPAQLGVLTAIQQWRAALGGVRARKFTFGGFAGVGKTTLLRVLLADWRKTAVLSFTGKAVDVLRRKGLSGARTVHSFLYLPRESGGQITFVKKPPEAFNECRTIVVDEAQTLNTQLYRDLMELDIPILFVGDMGQLKPIGDDPAILAAPDVVLTEIHRQAENSGIIRLSRSFRCGDGSFDELPGEVEFGDYRELIEIAKSGKVDQVLCGFNSTRAELNRILRQARGMSGPPKPGERLICLKNSTDFGVFNGMMATVKKCTVAGPIFMLDLIADGGTPLRVPAVASQFGLEKLDFVKANNFITYWDYGYAITAHKAMGSEWDRVAVFEQIHQDWDWRRWAYTASTRAASYLFYATMQQ